MVVLYLCRVCKQALKFSNDGQWKYYDSDDLKREIDEALKKGIKVRLGVCPQHG